MNKKIFTNINFEENMHVPIKMCWAWQWANSQDAERETVPSHGYTDLALARFKYVWA